MNAEKRMMNSVKHIGPGTYTQLWPIITRKGLDAGWRYDYPVMLNLGGTNYSKFTTLDALLEQGFVELTEVVRTGV